MDMNFGSLLPLGMDGMDDLPDLVPPSSTGSQPNANNQANIFPWSRPNSPSMNRSPGFVPPMPEQDNGLLPADSINPMLLSLAMAFVPYQAWEMPYEADVALQRGTIFPSLDKPFIGEEAVSR